MQKENSVKIWKIIQEAGDFLRNKLPNHPDHPQGRNPYAHVALCIKTKFNRSYKDIDDEKLKVARDLGASLSINSSSEDAANQIMEATGGGAKAIVDFVGAEASVNLGYQCLSKGGKQVIVGLFGGQLTIPLPLLTLT